MSAGRNPKVISGISLYSLAEKERAHFILFPFWTGFFFFFVSIRPLTLEHMENQYQSAQTALVKFFRVLHFGLYICLYVVLLLDTCSSFVYFHKFHKVFR